MALARWKDLCPDAVRPADVTPFWSSVLALPAETQDSGDVVLRGSRPEQTVWFNTVPEPKSVKNRVHLDLVLPSYGPLIDSGGRVLDDHRTARFRWTVLADPEGNELCIIEPGNTFLAGCGRFGSITCDGSPQAGYFWSEALGWPLVWDQDEETAIQSQHGGTKVAWGGPPVASHVATTRQRFDLVPTAGDQGTEAERLVSLGASRLTLDEGDNMFVALADPDGNEFRLLNHHV
jgi:catechol 2,3-dioxygenase-like lactoylglutathione lyase family enzyme